MKFYEGLNEFQHQVVDHAVEYVNGKVHTNGLENYWSLVKRGLNGTYISVEPFHLFRYLDEQNFRYNNRKYEDGTKFLISSASNWRYRRSSASASPGSNSLASSWNRKHA